MGHMNLLKANWTGKVGQTVGAKWKDKSTIRSYTKPSDPKTPDQLLVRGVFGQMSKFISLFSDQIKSLSALDTKGMSVRNAIIKLNKEQIKDGAFDPAELQISRGGLPNVAGFTAASPAGLEELTASWTEAEAITISEKAKVVVIFVNAEKNFCAVGSALNSAGTLSIEVDVPAETELSVYYYLLDYRGSSRVGAVSKYTAVTSPEL